MTNPVLNVSQSLFGRQWSLREADDDKIHKLAAQKDISPILARILITRDVSASDADSFLKPRLRDLLPDPSIMAGMDEAVQYLCDAVINKKPIAICGDYDADGITASAVLKKYFHALGCDLQVYLPDRMRDGYGLNIAALDEIKNSGRNPVITVDCGAKDIEALTHAQKNGLNVIILDHHPADVPPPACAFVNPNGPQDTSGLGMLTAAGVSFMFLVALNRVLREKGMEVPDLMPLLDLVALGTICDVAPLIGVNRAFAMRGLDMLAQKGNIGLAALADSAGLRGKPNVETFSFLLGPRINAAGRIGHADAALNLLTSDDKDEARSLAAQLNSLNRQRKTIEGKIFNEALARLLAQEKNPSEGICVAGQGWHPGVVGIVAARLCDRYHCPAAVIAMNGEQGIGSARAGMGIDLGAIITQAQQQGLLSRGGGHAQAAGFTISADKIDDFSRFFAEGCAAHKSNRIAALEIDAVLDFSAANYALYRDFQNAAPFGKGNPHPCVVFTDARLMHMRVSASDHLFCSFQPATGGAMVEAVAFRQGQTDFSARLHNSIGEVFHLAGHLRPAWRDARRIDLFLEDAVQSSAHMQAA